MSKDLSKFLKARSEEVRAIVMALREVIFEEAPGVVESCVWNALSYHRPEIGGRVKGEVCMIVIRNGKVRLDFIHGIRMRDPKHLLQGDLVSKRYVMIDSLLEASQPAIAALIRGADSIIPISEDR